MSFGSVWNDACIVLREGCVAGGGLPLEKWVDELVGEVRAGGSHLSYRSSLDHGLSDSDVVRAVVPIKRPPGPIVVDPPRTDRRETALSSDGSGGLTPAFVKLQRVNAG